MLEQVLPLPVVVAEAFHDPVDVVLFRQEKAVIRRSIDKRRGEFTTVRWCARHALDRLGEAPHPLIPDECGAPRRPDGVVGSMTHCEGYRAAAVARTCAYRAIGIDAEPDQPVPKCVLGMVALPAELRRLSALGERDPRISWDRLLFSAKETVCKTWYPLTRRPLGFHQADIDVLPDGTFTAYLSPSSPHPVLDRLAGRWTADRVLLLTVISVPAGEHSSVHDRTRTV
ncbi:4'-phosphopantetheinyl transferase superfamily protein [Streptomyces microflavus]|uniref:4'-phosphopantetheinyl transferase family protein n=1 Tax=Streptomyces microflavus TaxID=1919 RepID=UPI0033223090|nr:4'-phosphopantetheinyl transferase superfamily protein [Streptomyces microflavus]WST13126.1 4'-phosphopantetheinyl transferase superfamily protein [Streptomyces microflavus]